jgi:hypothetical protein
MLSIVMLSVLILSVSYKYYMLSVVMLNVLILSVTYKYYMLSVVMLNVVKLSVAAPRKIICHQNENGCRQSDVSLKLISVTGRLKKTFLGKCGQKISQT